MDIETKRKLKTTWFLLDNILNGTSITRTGGEWVALQSSVSNLESIWNEFFPEEKISKPMS